MLSWCKNASCGFSQCSEAEPTEGGSCLHNRIQVADVIDGPTPVGRISTLQLVHFLSLMTRDKASSAKQSISGWRPVSPCEAGLFANSSARISMCRVFVLTCNLARLKNRSFVRVRRKRPSVTTFLSLSRNARWRTVKKIRNRIDARTQSCFAPPLSSKEADSVPQMWDVLPFRHATTCQGLGVQMDSRFFVECIALLYWPYQMLWSSQQRRFPGRGVALPPFRIGRREMSVVVLLWRKPHRDSR